MQGIIETLAKTAEYQNLTGMLKQCQVLLKLKGEIYSCKLKLYTMQFAMREINSEEYIKLVEELQHDIKKWIAGDSSKQRWNLQKLISTISDYVVNELLNAILEKVIMET